MNIGIVDSGVGGLSILQHSTSLLSLDLPLHFHYIADQLFAPYGNKTSQQLLSRLTCLVQYLITNHHIEIMIIACNSATVSCIKNLRQQFNIPFIGMEPCIKPAVKITNNKKIAIWATAHTLASLQMNHLLKHFATDCHCYLQDCRQLVTLAEQGIFQGDEVTRAVNTYSDDIFQHDIDTLVLGCSHYPLFRQTINQLLGPYCQILDSGAAIIQRLKTILSTHSSHHALPQKTAICLHSYSSNKQNISQLQRLIKQLALNFKCYETQPLPTYVNTSY